MSSPFTGSFYEGLHSSWTTLSIAAAAIAILGSTTLILVSRLFSLRNLEQVAKTEFIYAISTVLIVLMTVGIITITEPALAGDQNSLARCLYLNSFGIHCDDPAFANADFFPTQPAGGVTLLDWMKLYMDTPAQCVKDFMRVLYVLAIPVDAITSFYMEIFMSEHASGFGLKWVSERIMNATQSLTFYIYINYLLGYIFDFVKYYAGFFFSVGVAMRAFPPTRGAGAYVMAMAFGLYFVFPLSYMLVATLGMPHVQSNIVVLGTNETTNAPAYICSLPQVPDITGFGCGAQDPGKAMEIGDRLEATKSELSSMLFGRMDDFFKYLIHSICIFPMISFVILLTFVLNTTNLFGGNIPEIGRGLVKLI